MATQRDMKRAFFVVLALNIPTLAPAQGSNMEGMPVDAISGDRHGPPPTRMVMVASAAKKRSP